MEDLFCPHCDSKTIVKKGVRKNIYQELQLYYCKSCDKTFSPQLLKKVKYPPKVILKAISFYNLGYTQEQAAKEIAKRNHVKVPQTTISDWINQFKDICTFNRIREQATKLHTPEEIIFRHNLQHNQIYKYQLHKAKLHLLSKELPGQKFRMLKDYIEKIPTQEFPHHIFQPKQDMEELTRSSQLKFETLDFVKLEKENLANVLASLGLQLAKTNKERHEAIQDFMITNDSSTIACEVPLYLTGDDIRYYQARTNFQLNFQDYQTPITGHIDVLQIRNGLIQILDYKPDADKVNAVNQLTVYALALASRTKLAVKDFKCAWFDDKHYYEFFPLHAVYRKEK